ncbi:hypothetical protein CDO73_06260 [Saccharibacillus sp. O23]|uniref:peptidoglycan DD-metalloendopeptidase family protein n=1 Tax=Saccharibacillus sp. O23 TaxID=2009338 RepID=UPI000B4E7DC7|nr:peptidoglycan DD-metalloendopeptidase family protein [Saccharibacillus sp. O23]OWR32065.1 hypothetical protein CDO73_06260 [Saccharibacillus sp. O23]
MESLDNKDRGKTASSEQSEMRQEGSFEAGVQRTWKPRRIRRWAAGAASVVLLAGGLTFGGFKYKEAHTYTYYTVYSGDTVLGTIADKQQVDELIAKKQKAFSEQYPNADMKLYASDIRTEEAEGYKVVPDTEATLAKLDGAIKAYATGTELVVNGKVVGIVKDEATAKKLIDKAKNSYIEKGTRTAAATTKLASTGGANKAASADKSTSKLESIKISSKIAYNATETSPTKILSDEEAYKLLTIGEKEPVTYKVVEGDTVSSIAAKFGITQDEVYANNSDIEEFTLQIGQTIRITLPEPAIDVVSVEKVSEVIPTAPQTIIRHNSKLAAGKRIVASPGKSGAKRVDYRLTKQNGEIVNEQWIGQEVVRRSAPIIIVKGTKVMVEPKKAEPKKIAPKKVSTVEESSDSERDTSSESSESSSSSDNQEEVTSGGSGFSWPVGGASISSTFGTRWGKLHAGVDLTGPSNIKASAPGTVTYAGQMNGYGNIIIISHGDGYETRYGHLSSIKVSVGESVSRGESIGVMGNTGRSTGTHLHFEIRKNGDPKNPLSYLP